MFISRGGLKFPYFFNADSKFEAHFLLKSVSLLPNKAVLKFSKRARAKEGELQSQVLASDELIPGIGRKATKL